MKPPATQPFLYVFPRSVESSASGKQVLNWSEGVEPFGASLPLEVNPALHEIFIRPGALTEKECRAARELGESRGRAAAGLERGNPAEYRASAIAWLEPQPEARWLYHRLGMIFAEANRAYRFELMGFVEALQYTVYDPGGKFDWHIDLGPDMTSARKLSVSVQLSPADEYEGGELEFLNARRGSEALGLGTAIFFPSYMVHRVTPLTRGRRCSLVAWAYGPRFR